MHWSDERLELLAELQEVSSDLSSTDKELQESLVALNKLEHSAVDFGVRLNFLERTTSDEEGKGSDILREIKNYEETAEKLKAESERCEASAKEFRDKIADAEAKIASAKAKIEELREERENELEKLNELKVEKNTLLQSADALRRMEQHLEGYSGSVRFVMKEYADGRPRHDRGQSHNEGYSSTHTHRGIHLWRYAQEGADTEELCENDIINENRTDDNCKIWKLHNYFFANLLNNTII